MEKPHPPPFYTSSLTSPVADSSVAGSVRQPYNGTAGASVFRLFTKRAALKKWLLIGVFGVMSLGMVIALAPTGPTNDVGPGRTSLAEVGGNAITTQDLQRLINLQIRSPYSSHAKITGQMA